MHKFVSLTAILALATGAAAQAQAAPVTYEIDPTHTFPRFSYDHFGLSTQLSRFDKVRGVVVLDKEAKAASVDIVIDTTSVNTGYETFNGHLQAEDFLDTARYPTATFKSTKVTFEGDRPVSIDGDLTIKGITRPVTLQVTHFVNTAHPMLKRDAIGANATTVIKRTEFNAGKYAPNVGDEVTLTISLEAIAK